MKTELFLMQISVD